MTSPARTLRPLLIALALTACAGCGARAAAQPASASPSADPPAAAPCKPVRGESMLGDALLFVPSGVRAPLPLVVAFHGARGTGEGFSDESGLSRSGARHGFAG